MSIQDAWTQINHNAKIASNTINKNSIMERYVPTHLGEYAKFDSSKIRDVHLIMGIINTSGSSINITSYNLYFTFKEKDGTLITKPSTSPEFNPESIVELLPPYIGEFTNEGGATFMFKCNNILSEMTDEQKSKVAYWTINFTLVLSEIGAVDVEIHNMFSNFHVSIRPPSII